MNEKPDPAVMPEQEPVEEPDAVFAPDTAESGSDVSDGADAPTEKTRYVEKLQDDDPAAFDAKTASSAYGDQALPSGFTAVFGESRFLAVLSILSGAAGITWLIMYFGMLLNRESMFTQAIEAMRVQDQFSFSVTFTSPWLNVLRVMIYIIPALALVWSFAVAFASRKNKGLGKKAVLIAVLALFAVVGIVAVFDVGRAGLVFDIVKS